MCGSQKDKVRKLFGLCSSPHLQQDWKAAETNSELLTNAEWNFF